jgi:salicylate hydroxylase
LLRAGFDVHVYEQASTLSEVRAGINIGPNASRILHRLGIAEELKKLALSRRASISGGGRLGGLRFWGTLGRPCTGIM